MAASRVFPGVRLSIILLVLVISAAAAGVAGCGSDSGGASASGAGAIVSVAKVDGTDVLADSAGNTSVQRSRGEGRPDPLRRRLCLVLEADAGLAR